MDEEYIVLWAHLFLFFCILIAFAVLWCELFDPPGPELLNDDDEPVKHSGSYWADCLRRGDCYDTPPAEGDDEDV